MSEPRVMFKKEDGFDSRGAYQEKEQVYVVPMSGNYMCSAKQYVYVPTGRKTMQKNYGRKWWQFWKPKETLQDEFIAQEYWSGQEVKYLEAGQEIDFKDRNFIYMI